MSVLQASLYIQNTKATLIFKIAFVYFIYSIRHPTQSSASGMTIYFTTFSILKKVNPNSISINKINVSKILMLEKNITLKAININILRSIFIFLETLILIKKKFFLKKTGCFTILYEKAIISKPKTI